MDTSKNGYKYIVDFDFSISAPHKKVITQNNPVFEIVPQNSTNNTTQTTTLTEGKITTDAFNNTTYQSKSTTSNSNNLDVLPSNNLAITGYQSSNITTMQYERILNLSCSVISETKVKKVWFVDAKSIGYSNDLRRMLPILLFAAKDFIEYDSNFEREINFNDNNNLKRFLNKLNSD